MVTTTRMTITIESDLLKDLAEMAANKERSLSRQIVYLVKKGKESEESSKTNK